MLSDYKIFDAHCDSITVKNLLHTKKQLEPRDMYKYPGYIQVFAICCEQGARAYGHNKHFIERYDRLISNWGFEKILSRDDLLNTQYGGILGIEGADAINNLATLRMFYNMGVRALTLTWNNNNSIATAVKSKEDNGLTDFGRKVVKECENLGIVTDLSHISVKSFYDVAEIAEKPFICSHSNSRTLYEHDRGLTDDQFKILVSKGGVAGINFAVYFLGKDPSVKEIVDNVEYFCSLGGEKNIGMGSDFDGINKLPRGCTGATFMNVIAEELLKHNYKEETVRNIMYGNFMRVFKEILK